MACIYFEPLGYGCKHRLVNQARSGSNLEASLCPKTMVPHQLDAGHSAIAGGLGDGRSHGRHHAGVEGLGDDVR